MIIDLSSELVSDNFKKIDKNFIERFLKKTQIEQIGFRIYLCKSCLDSGKCSHCSCNPIDTISEPISCNSGNIFPNFMSEYKWEEFKKQHNIIIENELLI